MNMRELSPQTGKHIETVEAEKPFLEYYDLPNVGYSLMHRVTQRKIILAEIVSTHIEMIFIFDQKHLSEMMEAFS